MLDRFEQFCLTISSIYQDIQKIERDEMERCGFKGSYAQYLSLLIRHPEGLTAAQLGELCDKDKAAVSRAVTQMMDQELLRRENVCAKAYRARLVLTQKGKEAAEFVCARAMQAVEAGGRGLSDEDRNIFYAALELIASNLQTISREGIPNPKTM